VYYFNKNGPYCTTCWGKEKIMIRLKRGMREFISLTGHKYICPSCDSRHIGETNDIKNAIPMQGAKTEYDPFKDLE